MKKQGKFDAAFIVFHGTHASQGSAYNQLIQRIDNLLKDSNIQLHSQRVLYTDILEHWNERIWEQMSNRISWRTLRRFLLSGFTKVLGHDLHHRPWMKVYEETQLRIAGAIYDATRAIDGDGKIIIRASSVMCHSISCFFWDAQKYLLDDRSVDNGFWSNPHKFARSIKQTSSFTKNDIYELGGRNIRAIVTTGNLIPLLITPHLNDKIIPIKKLNSDFEWHNYYNRNDVLSWPLGPLSDEYGDLVQDHISKGAYGLMLNMLTWWNPLSHHYGWADVESIRKIASILAEE